MRTLSIYSFIKKNVGNNIGNQPLPLNLVKVFSQNSNRWWDGWCVLLGGCCRLPGVPGTLGGPAPGCVLCDLVWRGQGRPGWPGEANRPSTFPHQADELLKEQWRPVYDPHPGWTICRYNFLLSISHKAGLGTWKFCFGSQPSHCPLKEP